MALIKDFKTPHGVTASYHKITKIEMDILSQSATVCMAVYFSQEARDSGGSPLWYQYVVVPFSALTSDPRKSVYGWVKDYFPSYLLDAENADDSTAVEAILVTDAAKTGPLLAVPENA